MATERLVTGDKRIDRALKHMRRTAARRVVTAGLAEGAKIGSKKVKATIPSRYKGLRKTVGWRRLKVREAPEGGAKIGAAVGRAARVSSRPPTNVTAAGKRRGVGLSARNIQWAFLGTKRGMEPLIPPVDRTLAGSRSEIMTGVALKARQQFVKEVRKGKAF